MKTLSKKLLEALFGQVGEFTGGTHVVNSIEFPQEDGSKKMVYWAGNEGLIYHLIKRIEKLEKVAPKNN